MSHKYIQRYKWILLSIILVIGLVFRLMTLNTYGVDLTLGSDDLMYQKNAVNLLETGMLTYHDPTKPTIHIMPGQVFLLAGIFFIFGHGSLGVLCAKLVMIAFGILSIYMAYKIGTYILNPAVGLIAALLLALYPPEVVVENLTLTESPFLFLSLGLLYWSLKLADTHSMKDFYIVLLFYFVTLYFRVQIALYPILLFVYLLMKRYPFRLMIKQALISVMLLFVVLGPWWARNYIQFHKFIPLTAGAGNPLLLGTYQGEGYPGGKSMEEIDAEIHAKYPNIEAHELMEKQQEIAMDRIKEWWHTDKRSMIKSYLVLKPQIFWEKAFYYPGTSISIFNISGEDMKNIYELIKTGFIVCSILAFTLFWRRWREYSFLWMIVLFQTYFNCLYFAYERYTLPLMPMLFIMIGAGIVATVMKVSKLLFKKEIVLKG
ncbi:MULTISPECIES: glycosyltransferase family 39 protein [unclassified Bacillus (in: firmicutes)]|uniref:glycosyltransferase family 39 protein n=1 Tax=unclassified Bacillus (in: firmicutes) TaxID=185979 RepID=UPI000BF2E5FC|nr:MULTISPECIES: glycosyltransferase family 39 protein [unclassified Bacillus (in: firmicutes)]PEU15302.1 4-amino-4-deoxy-L-arabinose transferase [Bacillus sp. AFS019443]PEU17325.1 4-amino-4-deoxy-L-arabinose transferase [Bacillus sp. AFS014408]PFW61046.1 4-amino-4-deoxy-L-arabinose transferase [Bacillus sp. AFS075034]